MACIIAEALAEADTRMEEDAEADALMDEFMSAMRETARQGCALTHTLLR